MKEGSRKFQLFTRRVHIASFNGRHNHIKAACLLVLYHRRERLGILTGLDCAELAAQAGVDANYIRSKVGKWTEWKYVNQKAGNNRTGRPTFVYSLAVRGQRFIEERMSRDIVVTIVNEIKANRTSKP
jgi:predicted ArsR family transcriptional regulator